MLLLLFSWLEICLGWQVPSAFFYSSTRMLLASLTALGLVLFLGPFCIKKLYELKTGQSIRVEDCPVLAQLHQKKRDTPTMGGVLILSAIFVSMFLWMDLHCVFTLLLALTLLVVGAIGACDDYWKIRYKDSKGLSARKKFFGQLSLACVLVLYLFSPSLQQQVQRGKWFSPPTAKEQVFSSSGKEEMKSLSCEEYVLHYYIPFYKKPLVLGGVIGIALACFCVLFVIVGTSNAVNLTDGLDGLASGCLILVALVFSIVAFVSNHLELAQYLHIPYIEGSGEIAVFLCALIGACLGFLWFNGSPAQVFMGDTGSLPLGAVLGLCAILLRRELLLALVGGVFVMETLSVIIQVISFRFRKGKRVFLCTPFHHHFEYKGWPETKVVLRFWIVTLLLCLVGIVSLKLQ